MKTVDAGWVIIATMAMTGCVENTAPGNDREAALDAVGPPAATATAPEALLGVDVSLLMPQIIPPVDLDALSPMQGTCRFRMTEVGFPVLIYGPHAVIKLNGKLIRLPAAGEGRYVASGVEVTVRPLDPDVNVRGPFDAEFVLQLPGAPNELGFHGVGECTS